MLDDNDIAAQAKQFRKAKVLDIAQRIIDYAAEHGTFYVDEVENIGGRWAKPNLIGQTIRQLVRKGAIHRTGVFRHSTRPKSKSRLIFQYALGRPGMANESVTPPAGS